MPRFYFHFRQGDCRTSDSEGMILPDSEAAWFQAVRSARELFGEALLEGEAGPGVRVEIEDEEGTPILDLALDQVAHVAA